MTVKVPARREDVQVGRAGSTLAMRDPVIDMTYAVDDLTVSVWRQLKRPVTPAELVRSTRKPAPEVYERIEFLTVRGLLRGARSNHNAHVSRDTVASSLPIDPDAVSFHYTPGLKHACQACGSCCSATDVGPVRPAIATGIRAHDWTHLESLADGSDPFREVPVGPQADDKILLLQMKDDRCVFLSPQGLCSVHAALGPAAKPTPCRQFPYVFSERDGEIQVSLQMECRAYYKAREAAAPTETVSDDLRSLLRDGAPVHRLPTPLRVDTGVIWSHRDYLAFEDALVSDLRAACRSGAPVVAPFRAFGASANRGLGRLFDTFADERQHLGASSWEHLASGREELASGREEAEAEPSNFEHDLLRCVTELQEFCTEASRVAAERNRPHLADRFRMLGRAVRAASGAESLRFRWEDVDAARSVLTDLFVSGLGSKDLLRHCRDIRTGLAWLSLRSWLVFSLACARARDACRVSVRVSDLIDSMVTVCKMLRERAVLEVVDGLKSAVISIFLTSLERLAEYAGPRVEGPGGIG